MSVSRQGVARAAEAIDGASAVRVVIKSPLVKGANRSPYGSVQIPNLEKIRAMAELVLPRPGTAPQPWPPAESTSSLARPTS